MNRDGTDVQQLTDEPSYDFYAEYSPDGASIAWTAYRVDSSAGEIFVANVDGTDVRNVTNHPARDYLPAWSPDGRSIAFVSNRDGSLDIWTVEVATGSIRQVTDVSAADLEPDWAPDGKTLVYSSFRSGDGQHVFTQRIGEPGATQLTFGNLFLEETPEISPDGRWIVYVRGNVSPEGIYLVNVEGGTPVGLTTSTQHHDPAWSPDGDSIVYEDGGDIYVMDSDGTSPTDLTPGEWNDRRPHWGPGGN
jgi:TolB protein